MDRRLSFLGLASVTTKNMECRSLSIRLTGFYVRNEQKNKLYKLIEHVDIEYVFVAEKIVQYAEKNLEKISIHRYY